SDVTKSFCAVYNVPCMPGIFNSVVVVGGYKVQGETFNSSKMTNNGQCVVGENGTATSTWYFDDGNNGWIWAGVTNGGK
ncbi:9002_t:CDS:1, partial [Acaulospora colombiana]